MARRTGTSRVSGGGGQERRGASSAPAASEPFPSLRKRKPLMFWTVMIAVGAMVLATGASFLTAFL